MFGSAERETAVRLARAALEAHLGPAPPSDPAAPFERAPLSPVFEERRGVFVTLTRAGTGALRGCIGHPLPVEPLRRAIPHLAVAAGVEDPRFPPVRRPELGGLAVEISVLTVPTPIVARDGPGRRAEVVVGRDGLIVEARGTSGLLLPQVAPEQGWDSAGLLSGVCEKAGLPADAWLDLRTRLYRFEAEVFGELHPGGPVRPVPLTARTERAGPRG
jgi:uncharacterized protein